MLVWSTLVMVKWVLGRPCRLFRYDSGFGEPSYSWWFWMVFQGHNNFYPEKMAVDIVDGFATR